jgi:hypothetical protein
MIIRVTIRPIGNVPESVVTQMSQKARVTLVPKILLRDVLLKERGDFDSKGASVRRPIDQLLVLLLGEHVVDLLREGHLANFLEVLVVHLSRHGREVPVGVVHVGPGLLDDLDCPGLHRELVKFHPSLYLFALHIKGVVTGG